MRTVRTTMRPADELEVTEQEYLDLQRQGLLAGEPADAEPPVDTVPPEKPAPRAKGAGGGQ